MAAISLGELCGFCLQQCTPAQPLVGSVGDGNILFEVAGVRKGCIMSTVLFNLVVDWIMPRTTEDKVRGIGWTPFLLPGRTGLRCRFRLSVTLTQTRRFHRPIYF